MKIAYLFHGHSRTWKECYESFFDNVFSVAPGDIYIHTWDRINSKMGSWWNGNFGPLHEHHEIISSEKIDLDGIIHAYNPKGIMVEQDKGIDLPLREYPQLAQVESSPAHLAVYNMFKSQNSVFNMAKKIDTYDRYFSCRPDLFFKNRLDVDELYENEEYIIVPPTLGDPSVGSNIFDIFAIGSYRNMEIRANTYRHLWDYWYSKNVFHVVLEPAVTNYYRDNGIKFKSSNLLYEIKRLF